MPSPRDRDLERALALARRARVDTRVVRAERRGDRVLVELTDHVIWVAVAGSEHHRHAMADPRVADVFAAALARLFAAVHTALPAADRARLIEAGLPTAAVIDWPDIARGAAALEGERSRRAQALIDADPAQPIAADDRTFLKGISAATISSSMPTGGSPASSTSRRAARAIATTIAAPDARSPAPARGPSRRSTTPREGRRG